MCLEISQRSRSGSRTIRGAVWCGLCGENRRIKVHCRGFSKERKEGRGQKLSDDKGTCRSGGVGRRWEVNHHYGTRQRQRATCAMYSVLCSADPVLTYLPRGLQHWREAGALLSLFPHHSSSSPLSYCLTYICKYGNSYFSMNRSIKSRPWMMLHDSNESENVGRLTGTSIRGARWRRTSPCPWRGQPIGQPDLGQIAAPRCRLPCVLR